MIARILLLVALALAVGGFTASATEPGLWHFWVDGNPQHREPPDCYMRTAPDGTDHYGRQGGNVKVFSPGVSVGACVRPATGDTEFVTMRIDMAKQAATDCVALRVDGARHWYYRLFIWPPVGQVGTAYDSRSQHHNGAVEQWCALSGFEELTLYATYCYDQDGNHVIDMLNDILGVSSHYAESKGHPNWDDLADIDESGVVNLLDDIITVSNAFGMDCRAVWVPE